MDTPNFWVLDLNPLNMYIQNETLQKIVEQSPEEKNQKPLEKKIMVPNERGVKLIHNPAYNKGTAFTEDERRVLGLKGLLPPRIIDQSLQADRIIENLGKKATELEKYEFMVSLQDRNENLFYYVLQRHLETVGQFPAPDCHAPGSRQPALRGPARQYLQHRPLGGLSL